MTATEAGKIVSGFSALGKWDELEPEGRKRLVQALIETCPTVAQAKEVADRWISSQRFVPTPADLRAVAREAREDAQSPQDATKRRGCSLCGGTGWEGVLELITREQRVSGGFFTKREVIDGHQAAIGIGMEGPPDTVLPRYYMQFRPALAPNQTLIESRRLCRCTAGAAEKQEVL